MRSTGSTGKKASAGKPKTTGLSSEETQAVLSALGDETQDATAETQTNDSQVDETQVESQGTSVEVRSSASVAPVNESDAVVDDDEPMEWPDSPGPVSAELVAD
jgi:hypothetical protein